MTTSEFSDQFDILLNSYNESPSFGQETSRLSINLNEYEKSVFLTQAQEQLITTLYSGKNSNGDSFESSEELRRYLSSLVKTAELEEIEGELLGLSSASTFFSLPSDCWFITYEQVTLDNAGCLTGQSIVVVPTTQDEYDRISRNPFRNANNRRALRLDHSNGVIEVICKYDISKYLLRYLSQPTPIILTELSDDLSINGVTTITECSLNPAIHRLILEQAVKLAIQSKKLTGSNN